MDVHAIFTPTLYSLLASSLFCPTTISTFACLHSTRLHVIAGNFETLCSTVSSYITSTEDKKLLVLVHAAAVSYHSYWTIELRDECGASIKAWMDPLLEETEIVEMLQTGVVWLLQHLVVLPNDDDTQQNMVAPFQIVHSTSVDATRSVE